MWGLQVCATHAGARVGRKSRLTDELAQRMLQVIRSGGYDEAACALVGVSQQVFREWMRRGNPEGTAPLDEPFRRFRAEVEKARAESEARSVAVIANAAPKNWQAAAWLLERRWPERWARVSQRAEPEAPVTRPADPFAEVDELAQRRRG